MLKLEGIRRPQITPTHDAHSLSESVNFTFDLLRQSNQFQTSLRRIITRTKFGDSSFRQLRCRETYIHTYRRADIQTARIVFCVFLLYAAFGVIKKR